MGKTVEFIFDFASPNAYLAHCILPDIARRTDADIKVTPCLLGGIFKLTGNQAPMTAFGDVKGKLAYEALETRRFVEKHGLKQVTDTGAIETAIDDPTWDHLRFVRLRTSDDVARFMSACAS